MQQIKPEFLNQTVALWQPRASRALCSDDVRQILDNTCGFFDVLAEWKRADQHDISVALPPSQKSTR